MLAHAGPSELITALLVSARRHLAMDVACVAEIDGSAHRIRFADGDLRSIACAVDVCSNLDDVYCRYVMAAREASVIPDTACQVQLPALVDPGMVRAYIGVPIRLDDGELYGTLCCMDALPKPALGHRDVRVLRVLADVIAGHVQEAGIAQDGRRRRDVEAVLGDPDALQAVFQPVVDLRSGAHVGYEALSRFPRDPSRPVSTWFDDATALGLAEDLELHAVRTALAQFPQRSDGAYLAVNLSPPSVTSPAVLDELAGTPSPLVVEITEHVAIDAYDHLRSAIARLRSAGCRLAVDDVGAGYASLKHILMLEPDILKLDITLTKDLDGHASKRALVASMVAFAGQLELSLVAEGIERPAEHDVLRDLGVEHGQGYLLGKPQAAT